MKRKISKIYPLGEFVGDKEKFFDILAVYFISCPSNEMTRECMATSFSNDMIHAFIDYEKGVDVEVIAQNLLKSAIEWRKTKRTVKKIQKDMKEIRDKND